MPQPSVLEHIPQVDRSTAIRRRQRRALHCQRRLRSGCQLRRVEDEDRGGAQVRVASSALAQAHAGAVVHGPAYDVAHLPQPLPYPVELAELDLQDGGGELGHAVVLAEHLGGLREGGVPLAGRAVVVQRDRAGGEIRIVGDDHPALAGGEHLVHLKTEGIDPTAGTYLEAVVPRSEGLSTVLDNRHSVCVRNFQDWVQRHRKPAPVHDHDRLRARGDAGLDAGGADLEVSVHVREHRNRPHGHHRIGAADERRRREDHLVARSHPERAESDDEGGRPRADPEGVSQPEAGGKRPFQRLDGPSYLRSVIPERRAPLQHVAHGGYLVVVDGSRAGIAARQRLRANRRPPVHRQPFHARHRSSPPVIQSVSDIQHDAALRRRSPRHQSGPARMDGRVREPQSTVRRRAASHPGEHPRARFWRVGADPCGDL